MSPDEIRAWREAIGWSQADLARALSIAAATVSRWEAGERSPPPFVRLALERLAQKLK